MNPLFSVVCTSLLLGLPAVLMGKAGILIPAYLLMYRVIELNFHEGVQPLWTAMGMALLETIALWALASWVFATKDVAVSVE